MLLNLTSPSWLAPTHLVHVLHSDAQVLVEAELPHFPRDVEHDVLAEHAVGDDVHFALKAVGQIGRLRSERELRARKQRAVPQLSTPANLRSVPADVDDDALHLLVSVEEVYLVPDLKGGLQGELQIIGVRGVPNRGLQGEVFFKYEEKSD